MAEVRKMMRDAADHNGQIELRSHYLLIEKEGATYSVKEMLVSTFLDGNLQMMRAYNRNGKEKDNVVKITCDA